MTSASDFGDDLFRGGFPYERLRVGSPVFGPLGDRRGEVGNTGEHATAEPFVVQFLEPALNQVEPGLSVSEGGLEPVERPLDKRVLTS